MHLEVSNVYDLQLVCRLIVKNVKPHFSVFNVVLLVNSATRVTASCNAVFAVVTKQEDIVC